MRELINLPKYKFLTTYTNGRPIIVFNLIQILLL